MEQDYEINLINWAHSITELEDGFNHAQPLVDIEPSEHSALVSLTPPTYYRSKAFSHAVGINPLVNAADPILTLVTKLRRITIAPEVAVLHQNIFHEIKAFENKAQTLGYRPSIILAAIYVICALLDELIAITLWPEIEWKKYSLLDTFHKNKWESDRFFMILERSLQDPIAHIDLLELIYLCLRLGYEGKYRGMERGHFELRGIIDQLYRTIMQSREEFSRGLLISVDNTQHALVRKKFGGHLLPRTWITSTIMMVSLLTFFGIFYTKLLKSAAPINQLLNSLQPTQQLASDMNENLKGLV